VYPAVTGRFSFLDEGNPPNKNRDLRKSSRVRLPTN